MQLPQKARHLPRGWTPGSLQLSSSQTGCCSFPWVPVATGNRTPELPAPCRVMDGEPGVRVSRGTRSFVPLPPPGQGQGSPGSRPEPHVATFGLGEVGRSTGREQPYSSPFPSEHLSSCGWGSPWGSRGLRTLLTSGRKGPLAAFSRPCETPGIPGGLCPESHTHGYHASMNIHASN